MTKISANGLKKCMIERCLILKKCVIFFIIPFLMPLNLVTKH